MLFYLLCRKCPKQNADRRSYLLSFSRRCSRQGWKDPILLRFGRRLRCGLLGRLLLACGRVRVCGDIRVGAAPPLFRRCGGMGFQIGIIEVGAAQARQLQRLFQPPFLDVGVVACQQYGRYFSVAIDGGVGVVGAFQEA